jgi:predicted MFS family arabinose efflux permease
MLILIREISNRMRRILQLYKNAFRGLTRSAWMLSVVMLINRSGTMVLPFLSIYLTSSLGFSLEQSGLILSCFGIGSMAGAFLGGWLTDKFGHFYVQFLSLVLGGVLFIILAYVDGYYQLALGILILSTVAESFRPANSVSVSCYAKPENVSRAFSLNRMAINLGFSVGPALGGLLAAISFKWLFIADGTTCILAGLFFFFYFRNVKGHEPKKQKKDPALPKSKSAWKDYGFLVFTLLTSCFAVLFFQLFTTLPLYYREVYSLSEGRIGLLLGLNGLVVFGMEMIMVYLLGRAFRIENLIFTGLVLIGVGFLVLNMVHAEYILFLGMIILSIAEIFAMPFMVTFVVQRSDLANRGAYMGLYSFAYAVGHVFSPIMGTFIIGRYGFDSLWWVSGFTAVAVGLGFWFVTRKTP